MDAIREVCVYDEIYGFVEMIKATLKTLKLLPLSLVIVLSACNLPGGLGSFQNPSDAVVALPPAQTQIPIAPTPAPMMVGLPNPTPLPSNMPIWSAYNYVCDLTAGGSNMTMHLAWMDRSDSEEGYKVFRDKKLVTTLPPNSIYYADMMFVANGKSVSYSIEAFNKDWQVSTTTITSGCQ